MSFAIAHAAIQAVVGTVSQGAGHGIFHTAVGDGQVQDGGNVSVNTELNRQSVDNAKGNLDHKNKKYAELEKAHATSKSATAIRERNQGNDAHYVGMFKGRLAQAVGHAMERGPQTRHAMRADSSLKNPVERHRLKQFVAAKEKLNKVPKTGQASINPNQLPDAEKKKMFEAAVANGAQTTPFGDISGPNRKNYAALTKPAPTGLGKLAARPKAKDWAGMIVSPGFSLS